MFDTYNYLPAVTVAANGRIGLLWYRYLYDYSGGVSRFNYNIYFAILDAAGNLAFGPTNLTNNTSWGDSDDLNVPRYGHPRIVATSDNRFGLSWEGWYYGPPTGSCTSSCSVTDIYYAVFDTYGGVVRPITNLTNDAPGFDEWYTYPAAASLTGNRILLAFPRYESTGNGSTYDLYFVVLDSSGDVVKPMTNLSNDGEYRREESPDAVELSNGRIVVAWHDYYNSHYTMRFAVLDPSYNIAAGPVILSNPATLLGDSQVSIAADRAGHAILTWSDYAYDLPLNLYYTLVDSGGNILTPPMIFRSGDAASNGIVSGYEGYGNTSYRWTAPEGVDGSMSIAGGLAGGTPGGAAVVPISYANHGGTTATGVVITMTLDSALSYLGDSSGIVPVVSGSEVVWTMPDLDFLENRRVDVYVGIPAGASYGDLYPISITLNTNEPDANPDDNGDIGQVMAAHQVHLSFIARKY